MSTAAAITLAFVLTWLMLGGWLTGLWWDRLGELFSGPLGHRHDDPRHQGGDWDPPRDPAPEPHTQGSGRPWRSVRTNLDEGEWDD